MPFIPHTPESLVRRSDSKDPATTCKGITSSGRPCRRPLGTSPQCSPTAPRKSKNGVVAILEQEDDEHDGAAAFFCWQHQDQAETLTSGDQGGRRANIVPLQPRTSIDTLADRLGVLAVEEDQSPTKTKTKRPHTRPARKETLPQKWQDVDGPLLAVNSGMARTDSKRKSNLGLFCCFRSAYSDPPLAPRQRVNYENPKHFQKGKSKLPSSLQTTANSTSSVVQMPAPKTTASGSPIQPRTSRSNGLPPASSRPSVGRQRPSQTEYFLSLIPKTLSPQTTALLLAELAKPMSPHDEEGFIYMFWLTDDTVSSLDAHPAFSSLANTTPSTPNGRRKGDDLHAHAAQSQGNGAAVRQVTILLKIGRASNVQRRMNEWTRQCDYNLSLIRFYPHISSSTRPNPGPPPDSPNNPAKVPHAHKVERLIHLELANQRVKRSCQSCGKEHREWFEVEGTRPGLKKVDEVIRRWTGWGQRMGGSTFPSADDA